MPPFGKPKNIDFEWDTDVELDAIVELQKNSEYKLPKPKEPVCI